MASQMTQKVEERYSVEDPEDNTGYVSPDASTDDGRDDLLCGTRLSLELKRLEAAYRDGEPHDFEIVKTVSLRQLDPLTWLSIRETGSADFSLPESFFDTDYPGHYCRRLVSIYLRIPCIAGPRVSLNCALTLKQHTCRVKKSAKDAAEYRMTDLDGVLRTDVTPITSIAVSNIQSEGAHFEFGSASDRHRPFEGAGAISKWHVELTEKPRQFDYGTIADVVVHLRYTSLDGGPKLKKAAQDARVVALREAAGTSAGQSMVINVGCDYADQWLPFLFKLKGAGSADNVLRLEAVDSYLPFWAREFETARAYKVSLLVKPALSPVQFDLEKHIVLTGPSGVTVAWAKEKTRDMGNCTVLLAEHVGEDLKGGHREWTVWFSAPLPAGYVLRELMLVFEYSLS
ncbi:hypothetical protein F5Y17DRAFT_228406 [Xylariaceae sp. FL0594]|nr:hypothetical protein F5Y17DRAFT_228406 [Xylariaceae sp. FL0594]